MQWVIYNPLPTLKNGSQIGSEETNHHDKIILRDMSYRTNEYYNNYNTNSRNFEMGPILPLGMLLIISTVIFVLIIFRRWPGLIAGIIAEFPDDEFNIGKPVNESIGCPGEYFSYRSGQFEKAINDCVKCFLRPTNDTNILGSWLLTDVSHWDHERERVFILTTKSFLIIKYDFIALKILHHNKIRLEQIDTVLRGKLTYPQTSLVPRIEGITNGVASIICGNLFSNRFYKQKKSAPISKIDSVPDGPKSTIAQRFDFSTFRPIDRRDLGIRILWNRGKPLSLLSSWNPFAGDIPWITVKDHPIYASQEQKAAVQNHEEFNKIRDIYCVESFYNALISVFTTSNQDNVNLNCNFEDGPILMQNYVGIGAVIHNKNNFGFFKCRGKFSF